jgi:hypothetical protein
MSKDSDTVYQHLHESDHPFKYLKKICFSGAEAHYFDAAVAPILLCSKLKF